MEEDFGNRPVRFDVLIWHERKRYFDGLVGILSYIISLDFVELFYMCAMTVCRAFLCCNLSFLCTGGIPFVPHL